MPKKSHKFVRQGYLVDCKFCGKRYNNDKAIELHLKHSHSVLVDMKKKKSNFDIRCGICKKENCKMH